MRRIALIAAVAVVAFGAAAPALAQDDRRISDLQKQVRELRSIVFQGRDTGQPVVVRPEGPDPQVLSLQSKVDDLEQSLRRATGANEVMIHDLDEARRGIDQLRAQSASRAQSTSDRIAKLEATVAALSTSQAPAAPFPQAGADYPPPPGPTSRFPQPQTADAAPDPFADGAARLATADYPGAQAAFEAYLAAEPNGAKAPEARYDIGQSLYARENYPQAARSYALALKGWPKVRWAPDATVRLAASLAQAGRNPDACAALGEFDRRYAAGASPSVKSRATTVRRAASCTAG